MYLAPLYAVLPMKCIAPLTSEILLCFHRLILMHSLQFSNSNVLIELLAFSFQYDNVPKPCFQFRFVLSTIKRSYRMPTVRLQKKLEPVCSSTTPETPVRTTLQCLYNLRRHKIPITKANSKSPAKMPLSLVIVSENASNVDQLTDQSLFSTCMINESTFLQ